MSGDSPVESYRDACNALQDIQESYEEPGYLQRIRATCWSCNPALNDSGRRLRIQRIPPSGTRSETLATAAWEPSATPSRPSNGSSVLAEAGHAQAIVNLVSRPPSSRPLTHAAAIKWFRKAAELGYDGGMVWLGFSYREGDGVPCDHAEAVRWFIKAVEAGDAHSMIHVGRMYARYLSSPAQAVGWFLRAAEAGFTESFVELADLYSDTQSEVYNPAEAHKWYRVVAEHSEGTHSRALLAIAREHLDGRGVPCDVKMAKLWLRRLLQAVPEKSSAHREASKLLKKLEDQFL